MTNLEKEVTSYEVSRKLDEVGFLKDAMWCWFRGGITVYNLPDKDVVPCYSFQTLWEYLPESIPHGCGCDCHEYEERKLGLGWYDSDIYGSELRISYGDSVLQIGDGLGGHLPDLVAQAVLYCLENNYISVEEL